MGAERTPSGHLRGSLASEPGEFVSWAPVLPPWAEGHGPLRRRSMETKELQTVATGVQPSCGSEAGRPTRPGSFPGRDFKEALKRRQDRAGWRSFLS